MPLGFQRLNERQQRPNVNINFIKPLESPEKAIAEDFLQRIAAQCFPVMKKHHISVMSLEEYPPNPEFLGRNFNAGEVIQLVLKDKQGRWLSMKFVQMVMMHELAHCKQMNHSRAFWNVRNDYARQMEDLWREKYSGEGIWGRGRGLEDGRFVHDRPPDNSQIPEHLCGGSYRRRGRKRKRGQANASSSTEKLSYAERQQRRIARKFGKHGEGSSLGDDELLRGALETMNGGKRGTGKPRVANSKRGRELRANAALARFDQGKVKQEEAADSETESDWDEYDAANDETGVTIKDEHGDDLVKVCGDEDEDDPDGASNEMKDFRQLGLRDGPHEAAHNLDARRSENSERPIAHQRRGDLKADPVQQGRVEESHDIENAETESDDDSDAGPPQQLRIKTEEEDTQGVKVSDSPLPVQEATIEARIDDDVSAGWTTTGRPKDSDPSICGVCSLDNAPGSPTCTACANVLKPALMPNHWRCKSAQCKEIGYTNAGDAGRCGICGGAKPKPTASNLNAPGRDMGVTRAELLRWD